MLLTTSRDNQWMLSSQGIEGLDCFLEPAQSADRVHVHAADFRLGFTSKTTGRGLRLTHKERIILYMTPCEGHLLASFALGEKAVQAAHRSNLPSSILTIIDSAKKYVEGRGVRLKVTCARDVRHIEELAVIKTSTS